MSIIILYLFLYISKNFISKFILNASYQDYSAHQFSLSIFTLGNRTYHILKKEKRQDKSYRSSLCYRRQPES